MPLPLQTAIVCLLTGLVVLAGTETEAWAQKKKPQASPVQSTATQTSTTKTPASTTSSTPQTHRVENGQTLGGIARRYQVTINALCQANGIRRTDPIRPGQQLVIPPVGAIEPVSVASEKQPTNTANDATLRRDQQQLDVPGGSTAYYYEPIGPGHLGLRPVIMVLHGRGGNASAFCARWAPVARSVGWLVCPSAPHPHGDGMSWRNDWVSGKSIVNASLLALREKYGRRVQLVGNTLVGFSEGAFVAMNIGVRDARTFNRWLILASDDRYWGAAAPQLVDRARGSLRRVFLITGQLDGVHDGTLRAQQRLERVRVPVGLADPSDMGHEVALETRRSMYQEALGWLQK